MFVTVLHGLVAPGSDRAAEKWKQDYAIEGAGQLALHHFYRALAWLGAERPAPQQPGATPFVARTTKDLIEEGLFARRGNLFTGLELVFSDTTSIYFEGDGGQTVGPYGRSKDHRPDRLQMVVGVVLDSEGNPICTELWRYIVCRNPEQAVKDRQDREAMVASSRDALQKGDQSLVGNRGYRRFLRATGEHCTIDEDKMQQEERYDGQWVLTTNAALSARFEVRCSVRF